MRYALMAVTTLCLGSALLACNHHPNPVSTPAIPSTTPPTSGTASVAFDWSFRFQSTCVEGISVEACPGLNGFTLNSAGHYWVGGPNGTVGKEGTLSAQALEEFTQVVKDNLGTEEQPSNIELTGEEQKSSLDISGQNDVITLSRFGGVPVTIVRTEGGEIFFRLKTEDAAKSIYQALRTLVEEFTQSDVCSQGFAAAGKLITSLQTCSADADCAYYDPNLNGLRADSGELIVFESCRKIAPPAVANAKTLEANKDKLLQLFDLLVSSCESSRLETDPNCVEKPYALKGGAAVCQQGVCKANPSLLGTSPSH